MSADAVRCTLIISKWERYIAAIIADDITEDLIKPRTVYRDTKRSGMHHSFAEERKSDVP